MKRVSLLALILVALVTTPAAADIVINGYTAPTNDRFTNSSSFIMSQFNLSGVGQTDGGTSGTQGRWATAISRNVIITANHYRPQTGASIYFYSGNDAGATPVTRSVVSGMQVGSTDLWIGVLDSTLPSTIQHYNFATEMLTGTPPANGNIFIDPAGSFQDANAYMFGKSPFDHNADPNDDRTSYNDQAVGRNQVFGYSENLPFNGNTDNDTLVMWHDSPGDPDFVQYEAQLRGGDSGGPMFIERDGQLLLLGINSFLLNDANGVVASGITYVGNQSSAIQAFINANAIPEPASAGLGLIILAAGAIRRRRVA